MKAQEIRLTQANLKTQSFPLPQLDATQRYTVEEAARYLRTSRWTVYQMLKNSQIQKIKQGKRTFIPGSEIARLSALPTR